MLLPTHGSEAVESFAFEWTMLGLDKEHPKGNGKGLTIKALS